MQRGYCELYEEDNSYYLIKQDTINEREATKRSLKQLGINPLIRLFFYLSNTTINLKE